MVGAQVSILRSFVVVRGVVREHQMSGKSIVANTILMAFFLSSCEPGLEVSPASAGESLPAPAFRVSDSESAQPRFNTIVLLKQDGKIIWHVRSKPLAA